VDKRRVEFVNRSARMRALVRLAEAYPEVYQQIYNQQLKIVDDKYEEMERLYKIVESKIK